MKTYVLIATAALFAFSAAYSFAADEVAAERISETTNLPPNPDANTATESRAVPDNLQATRMSDDVSFNDIKILPSF